MENNAYFQVSQAMQQYYSSMSEEKLAEKISVAQTLLKKIENSEVWPILVEDAQAKILYIDGVWQTQADEKQLSELRIKKLAMLNIVELPARYEQEVKFATEQLRKMTNTDSEIEMDYDETKTEEV